MSGTPQKQNLQQRYKKNRGERVLVFVFQLVLEGFNIVFSHVDRILDQVILEDVEDLPVAGTVARPGGASWAALLPGCAQARSPKPKRCIFTAGGN